MATASAPPNQQQQLSWQSPSSLDLLTSGVAAVHVASVEQLLLAHGATASLFQQQLQAAALSSVAVAADHLTQQASSSASAAAVSASTESSTSAISFPRILSAADDVNIEHVSAYTVEEPSSDSTTTAPNDIDDADLDFLCELLSDRSSPDASPRSASPLAPAPIPIGWRSNDQVWSTSFSQLQSNVGTVQDRTLVSPGGAAAGPSLNPDQLNLDQFLSAYQSLSPAASESSMQVDDSGSVSFASPRRSLEHAGSIDDILGAGQPSSQITRVDSNTSIASAVTAIAAATTTKEVQENPLLGRGLLVSNPAEGKKRSPRLSATRRTQSAPGPSYKVTLPESDEMDRTSSSGQANDETSDENGAVVKRRRGSRSKKRRSASDTTAMATTNGPTYSKDSHRYRRRRDQNNEAVRRCRQRTKEKYEESVKMTASLQAENSALKGRLASMEKDMSKLRHRLATTQLSSSPIAARRFGGLMAAASSSPSSSEDEYMALGAAAVNASAAVASAGTASLWDMLVDMTG